jgi:hypothetical protein
MDARLALKFSDLKRSNDRVRGRYSHYIRESYRPIYPPELQVNQLRNPRQELIDRSLNVYLAMLDHRTIAARISGIIPLIEGVNFQRMNKISAKVTGKNIRQSYRQKQKNHTRALQH